MKRRNFLTLIAAAVGLPMPKLRADPTTEFHMLGGGFGGYVYTHFTAGSIPRSALVGAGRIFTWDQVADAENIPGSFLPPPGEWLKLPPCRFRDGFDARYLWQGKWGEMKYSRIETK